MTGARRAGRPMARPEALGAAPRGRVDWSQINWNRVYRLHIRLVMIADHLIWLQHPPLDRSTEEGLGRGQIAALPQEHIHHLSPLVHGSIEVVLLAAPTEEELVDIPPPAQPPAIAVCLFGQ